MTDDEEIEEEAELSRAARLQLYKRTAEAIGLGDIQPARGLLSVARSFLEDDVGATHGTRFEPDERHRLELEKPDLKDDPERTAAWSDLLEVVDLDPGFERGDPGA